MKVLQTARLRLIPVDAGNADQLWRLLQEPGLRDYQDLPSVDAAHFRRVVQSRERHLASGVIGRFEWLMYHISAMMAPRGAPLAIGWVSLRIHERDPESGEIGYSVIASQRGDGIATEAVRAIIAEGFGRAHLSRIKAYCLPENAPSRAVLKHLGFAQTGVLPHGATIRGHLVDVLAFVLERPRDASSKRPRDASSR